MAFQENSSPKAISERSYLSKQRSFTFGGRRHHCPGPRCVFPQRRETRGRAAPHPLGPRSAHSPSRQGQFVLHHSTWAQGTLGGPGPLSTGETEDTLPLINLFPRWGASVCKTCLLHWSKKTPSQTQLAVSGFCTSLPGSLCCPPPTINNTTRQELWRGGEGPFSTLCKSGSVSNLSAAEAFLCLFGWTGRTSLSASLGSSPGPRFRAARGQAAKGQSFSPKHFPPRQTKDGGISFPVSPGWTLPSTVKQIPSSLEAGEKEKGKQVSTCSVTQMEEDKM